MRSGDAQLSYVGLLPTKTPWRPPRSLMPEPLVRLRIHPLSQRRQIFMFNPDGKRKIVKMRSDHLLPYHDPDTDPALDSDVAFTFDFYLAFELNPDSDVACTLVFLLAFELDPDSDVAFTLDFYLAFKLDPNSDVPFTLVFCLAFELDPDSDCRMEIRGSETRSPSGIRPREGLRQQPQKERYPDLLYFSLTILTHEGHFAPLESHTVIGTVRPVQAAISFQDRIDEEM
ncbi:hypothetical protein EVAR_93260_1 [Eumeta japonica]|uniref:Uncharacterized protein n=1 Tax=Eumeta variegata TaxID=151549 RepID=A0A4C1TXQ7_EUMVA|nr:hypothetical protein EVAR_93260_1 [Eumeta japonica]